MCVTGPRTGVVGGLCYDNGSCNPGLLCNGTTCEVDATIPTGTSGGACYANGSCNPALVCRDSICITNTAPNTGLLGGVCYDNGSCNPGLLCQTGLCIEDNTIPQGTEGGACLINGTCNAGLVCDANHNCAIDTALAVGTVGAQCFPNGTCNGGLECVVTSSADASSAECAVKPDPHTGDLDMACWPNGTCNGGLICDLGTCVDNDSAITVRNGADGGLCYANGSCNSGLVCNFFGKCEPIVVGGLYGACDAAGGCNLGLSCQVSDVQGGTSCLPTVEHLGSIHGVVTDYINNARLAGVEVTLIHQGLVEKTTSDALGYYSFDNLKPGHFEITFASADGEHTIRRLGDVTVSCPLDGGYFSDSDYDGQDRECNQVHDIDLFPFTGTQNGRLWYLNDQEVTPAAGVTVIADYSDLCGCTGDNCHGQQQNEPCTGDSCGGRERVAYNCPGVDISPDRFTAVTDANGRYEFTDLPNTGAIGVRITVMPSVFNGFDYESWGPVFRTLDVFVQDNVEVFLTPQFDPPFIVANNWEDFLYGGYDVAQPIAMTFSRSMKTMGCDIHLAYDTDGNNTTAGDTEVEGTLVWSNDNMTATFTPAETLSTSKAYAVHVHNCESALDDQEYNWITSTSGGDLCCNIEGNACQSSESNRTDFITQKGIQCSLVQTDDECIGADDSFTIACNMAPNLTDSAFELYRVVNYPGHAEENPNGDGSVRVPVAFTVSADGNTVTVDPTASFDTAGSYEFVWTVASMIKNDHVSGETGVSFCKDTETIEFVLANVPVVSAGETSWLETTNGAQDIVMTFTKAVNLALSLVTIENDDAQQNNEGSHGDNGIPVDYSQFGLILDATITADGAVVTVNPAADLPVGKYTVRYVVPAADGLGTAVGHFTFTVAAAPACIAFTGDNLGDRANVNYNGSDSIELDFSTAVDTTDLRNIIKLVDEFGIETWPTFSVETYTNAAGVDITNGRVVVQYPDSSDLSPDRDYTLTFKIYAAASKNHVWTGADESEQLYPNGNGGFCGGTEHGIYTQPAPIKFTTEGHITLVSTTVGTYTDANNDGFYVPENCDFTSADGVDCGDFQGSTSFLANGAISLTFTEVPDLAVYHNRNFVRLYRFTGDDENNATQYDLVATTNTLSGKTVTLALLAGQTLQQPGGIYCIGYNVTSNIVLGGDADVSENVGQTSYNMGGNVDDPAAGAGIVPQLCFSTASPVVAPPTAPTAAPQLVLVNLVDSGDQSVTLRNSVLQGAAAGTVGGGTRWYEFYASAEDGAIDDYVLWQVREDCQVNESCIPANTVLGNAADGTTRAGLTVLGQNTSALVCAGPNAPVYCSAGNHPFADGESVFFRVRACTGSVGSDVTPLCGPYSAALEVSDSVPPDLLVYVLGAEANDNENSGATGIIASEGVNDICDGTTNDALTFNVFGFAGIDIVNNQAPSTRESLGGAATIAVRQGGSSAALAGVTCLPLVSSAAVTTEATDVRPLATPAAYTAYAPTWETPADSWPNWTTDANGWNTAGITMYDHRVAQWMYFPALSVVTFKCTVPEGTNPLAGAGGLNSTINITASDTSGNPKSASRPVPAGDQCAP